MVGPVYESRGLVLVDLQAQKFVIAVPRSHPLAAQRSVKIAALAAGTQNDIAAALARVGEQ